MTPIRLSQRFASPVPQGIDYWSLEKVLESWHDEMADRRHFSFFWGPQPHSLALYGLEDPDGSDCD